MLRESSVIVMKMVVAIKFQSFISHILLVNFLANCIIESIVIREVLHRLIIVFINELLNNFCVFKETRKVVKLRYHLKIPNLRKVEFRLIYLQMIKKVDFYTF